jgi:hypothetical protein
MDGFERHCGSKITAVAISAAVAAEMQVVAKFNID